MVLARAAAVFVMLMALSACERPTELLPPQMACDVGNVRACSSSMTTP